MSAALTTAETLALEAVVRPYALLCGSQSDRIAELVSLVNRLKALRHCDSCGCLFDGLATADACHRCEEDMRRDEALEARGGQL